MCYCCGQYNHYIELEKICTKFCLNSDTTKPRYGQDILIILPFNWGWEAPDRITLEDGTELPVPCDPLDGGLYGCNDKDSNGFRKPLEKGNDNGNKHTNEKIIIKPTTQPPKRRTTTFLKPAYIKPIKTIKTGTIRATTRRTTTRRTTTTERITTTKRATKRTTTTRRTTTTKQTSGDRVLFSLARPKPLDGDNKIKQSLTTKTTINSQSTTDKDRIWTVKKPRKEKETKMLDGLPVWG